MTDLSLSLPSQARLSMRRHTAVALTALILMVLGVGLLCATLTVSGAIISSGKVVFASYSKVVQHPTGGVVKAIRVREGQAVSQGDVLIELDPTVAAANRAIVVKSLDELKARRARLEAERRGQASMPVDPDLAAEATKDPVLASFLSAEQQLFLDRREAREGKRAQLAERTGQIDQQITGLTLQAQAKADEMRLITRELSGLLDLYDKKLIPLQRVTELQREEARLRGEHGQLLSSIAEARGRITETQLQIGQIDNDLQDEVSNELGKLESRFAELEQQRVAAEDQLTKLAITAPITGVVEGLSMHTVGGVIQPATTIMEIAPSDNDLGIEARISPSDIDQVWLGQKATLRLSAFNQRTTPELEAEVSLVPADLSVDQRSGVQYYLVRLRLTDEQIARLDGLKIVPGMPVECFIQTGDRTILSYITKPLADQLKRSFRHD